MYLKLLKLRSITNFLIEPISQYNYKSSKIKQNMPTFVWINSFTSTLKKYIKSKKVKILRCYYRI